MKIGLMSDIHGNVEALHKALALFNDLQITTILCAGDLVDGESYGDAVVATMQTRCIPCVQGNHDQDAFLRQIYLRKTGDPDDPKAAKELLQVQTIDYVSALPRTLTFRFGDVTLFLAHGTSWSNTVYLTPESRPQHFQRTVLEAQSDIVVLGHTHMPMCVKVGSTWIINPRSLERNRREHNQTCAVLDTFPFAVQIIDINTRGIVRTCGDG